MIKVLVPIFPSNAADKQALWRDVNGTPLCLALWRGLAGADGISLYAATNQPAVAEALAETGQGACALVPELHSETQLLPSGAGRTLELARRDGFVEGQEPAAIIDYRNPRLSPETIRSAARLATRQDAPVISLAEATDHPGQLRRHHVITGCDLLAVMDADQRRGPGWTRPFFLDWGFYGLDAGDGLYARTQETGVPAMRRPADAEAGAPLFEHLSRCAARRRFDTPLATDQGRPLLGVSALDRPENAACICLEAPDGAGVQVLVREDLCRPGAFLRAIAFDGCGDDERVEQHVLRRTGETVTAFGNRYAPAFTRDRLARSLALLFLAESQNGEMDLSEPLDLPNDHWELDPGTGLIREKGGGQAVTGRQQLPAAHMPDRTFAVARPSALPILDELAAAGKIFGFPPPAREAQKFLGPGDGFQTLSSEGLRNDKAGSLISLPGLGGLGGGDDAQAPARHAASLASGRAEAARVLEKGHMLRQFVTLHTYETGRTHPLSAAALKAYDRALARFKTACRREEELTRRRDEQQARRGCGLARQGRVSEALAAWRPVLRRDPARQDIRAELDLLAASGGPETALAAGLRAEFLCDYEGEVGLPFAQRPNCLAGHPELDRLFLSDDTDIHVLDLEGRRLGSLGLDAMKPRVLWAGPGVVWTRDFAPGRRRFLALSHAGGLLDSVPMEALVPENPQAYVPLSMCAAGQHQAFLLMHEKSCRSRIVLRDAAGRSALAATEEDGNHYAFLAGDGERLFVIDYFSGKILALDPESATLREHAAIRTPGGVNSMHVARDCAFALGVGAFHKLDRAGEPVYSAELPTLTGRRRCKTAGAAIVQESGARRLFVLDRKNSLIYKFKV